MYNKNVFIISFLISDFTFIGQNYSSLVIFMSYRFFFILKFLKKINNNNKTKIK